MNTFTHSPYFKYFVAVFGLCFVAAWIFVSSGFFMANIGHKFTEASFLTLYQYYYYYGDDQRVINMMLNSCFIGFAVTALPVALLYTKHHKNPFGDARLATGMDVKKAGLFADNGIFLGRFKGKYLFFDKGLHVMMTAETGAGKGVGIVIPNLLSWYSSVVVMDIKLENWQMTSGFRHKYRHQCFLFAPGSQDYRTHRCNPLSYISTDPNFRVDDINKVAYMFFPDKEKTDVIWTAGPRSLFLGIVLFMMETGCKLTLGNVLRTSLTGGDPKEFFEEEIGRLNNEGTPLSTECVSALLTYTSVKADNTRSGILSGFRAGLELFMNPAIDAATSDNDFDLRDIRKKKMSIYVGVMPSDIERFTPLIRLFFQLLIDLNTRELPIYNKELKYPCLLIMDEFAQLKMNVLARGVAFIRGYGLQLMPILQSPAQLVEIYGVNAAENFSENHAVKVVFPPDASNTKIAKEISNWFGFTTIQNESRSRASSIFGKRDASVNETNIQRPLMMPQEITALPETKEILVLKKTPPIIAERVLFYKEKVFVDRLKSVSPMLKRIRGLPNKKDYEKAVMAGELAAPVPTIQLNQSGVIAMPKIDNHYHFDWGNIKAPTPGYMDTDALYAYTDALCVGAGVLVDG